MTLVDKELKSNTKEKEYAYCNKFRKDRHNMQGWRLDLMSIEYLQ